MKNIFTVIVLFFISSSILSQERDFDKLSAVDYFHPKELEIDSITVTGVRYLQPNILINISGLQVGQKINIPGDEISAAIDKFWKYGLFSDVKILAKRIKNGKVFLEIYLKEQPRLSKLNIKGVNKSEISDLKEKINLRPGSQMTDNIINNCKTIIDKHYIDKGFLNVDVVIVQKTDTSNINQVALNIYIEKNKKVKIDDIVFEGNEVYTDKRLRRVMKKTKKKNLNIFKGSKFINETYKEDKQNLINFYNENGYRDAKLLGDRITRVNNKRIALVINLEEGQKYFVRKIVWVGNTKYPSGILNRILGVKKGDVYNKTLLEERLRIDEDAVSSLYLDNGYLFFSVSPVEVRIENDSIDLEMRVYEGKQASINKVVIKGNTKTNEHVVRRELRTRPGELFSKSDIIRSVRELATLGHFDPENINPNPIPNQADGTVDLEYQLEERANDQLELSGGFGGLGFVGTVGIRFSNFSARNMFNGKAWRPVPTGDGQTLSVRAQVSSKAFKAYNLSFIEPWFGGKKPNSFTVSLTHTVSKRPLYEEGRYVANDTIFFKVYGASIGLGRRLKWPDDYFTIYNELSYQRYHLSNYVSSQFIFTNGFSNLISLKTIVSRSSQDQMLFPRRGSNFSFGIQLTPPYSLFSNKDYSELSFNEKYKLIEFHKWTFKSAWYTSIIGNLVLATKAEYGYLGHYNNDIGPSPFEKFEVGGNPMYATNYIFGSDIVSLRGYPDAQLTPQTVIAENGQSRRFYDGNVYDKYTVELRYPVSLNPSATIYGLAFIEGGNAWSSISEFKPFHIKRSAGIGVRVFLPMFGLLGIDWGYGFDPLAGQTKPNGGEFHFVLGQQF
ncbi:MAG: outer membrane protein assembly factor BamA [Bacteroidales bacterium]|nr:MAG: outer membrane protein assembly factor BamA [Bacteroidales bacterium]